MNSLHFTIFAAAATQVLGASVPLQPPIFSGPCAILPPSNNTQPTSYDEIQSGASSLWGHEGSGGPKKWAELYVKGLIVIPYCFPTEEHRKANLAKVEAATELWITALGGKASEATGHKIMFSEWIDPRKKPMYCIDVNSPADSKWNMALPYKTVVIWKDDRASKRAASSTVGMGDSPGKPWDLNMWLGEEASVQTIAHEFGHVMGMMHEQQRPDRDTFIRYDCMKLTDYSTALARARETDPSVTTAELCNNVNIAAKYEFSGRSYTKSVLYGKSDDAWTLNLDTPYDVNSIMHYNSYIMGNEKCQRGNQAECPVAVYRDSMIHEKGFKMIPMWFKPSQWDAAWVKVQYGWTGCCDSPDIQGVLGGGKIGETGLDELLWQARDE